MKHYSKLGDKNAQLRTSHGSDNQNLHDQRNKQRSPVSKLINGSPGSKSIEAATTLESKDQGICLVCTALPLNYPVEGAHEGMALRHVGIGSLPQQFALACCLSRHLSHLSAPREGIHIFGNLHAPCTHCSATSP